MVNKNRPAFLQNVAALSLVSVPDAIAREANPANPQMTGRPPVQFDFAANLDKDDIYKFLDSNATKWDAPLNVPKAYSQSKVRTKREEIYL